MAYIRCPPPEAIGEIGKRLGIGKLCRELGRRQASGDRRRSPSSASPGATGERTYVRKSTPVDELHGEEPKLAVGNQVVEGHQVGVGNISQGAELLLEAEQRRGVRPLHGLERDSSVASAVVGLVDDSHAAAAHLAEDHIAHPRQVLFRDGVQR